MVVPSYVEQTPSQRTAEVGVLLPQLGSITGWASLEWQGGWWFTGTRADGSFVPVPVALPRHSIRPQPPFALCEERWHIGEVVRVDGLAVNDAVSAVGYAMRYASDLESAVVALDMAAFHDLVSLDEVLAWILMRPSYTGIEQARQAWVLGDENAWSPKEPVMRVEWEAAGFPRPMTNRPLFDPTGRHLMTPDLIDPVNGVVGEYQGGLHLDGSRRYADIKRDERYRSLGLEPVEMVAGDLPRRSEFRARLAAAYRRAEPPPVVDRGWTMELPHWWIPTFTVEQRRALTPAQRMRLLGNREAA